jgi:sugar lactone lactonase YvrE
MRSSICSTRNRTITNLIVATLLLSWTAAAAGVLRQPTGVFVHSDGTVLIADRSHNKIQAIDPWGVLTRVAGTGTSGSIGDGGTATEAELRRPDAAVTDGTGNIYISDTSNSRIRRVGLDGTITTIAGSSLIGFAGDGGPATAARLYYPRGVHVDGNGNLYIADTGNHRIRKVDVNGIITTVAGDGTATFSGDSGPATEAGLNGPTGIFAAADGTLYIADTGNHRVRAVGTDGTITTVAGNGTPGYDGDGGSALTASLDSPRGLFVDIQDDLYIADSGNHRIRRITSGTITTFAGTGSAGLSGDQGPATAAQLFTPTAVHGRAGQIYIADSDNDRIRRVGPDGIIVSAAGSAIPVLANNRGATVNEGGTVTLTTSMLRVTDADTPTDGLLIVLGATPVNGTLTLDQNALTSGDLFTQADVDAGRVTYQHNDTETANDSFTFTVTDQTNWLPGATFTFTVLPIEDGDEFAIEGGTGVDFHQQSVYYVERLRNKISRIDMDGVVVPIAGTGTPGSLGDGGSAIAAELRRPYDVYVSPSGEVYIADTGNHRIRYIDANGTIATIAGAFLKGFGGDGGPALQANLSAPRGISGDGQGNIYIADTDNHRIRRIDANGTITTVAGNGISNFSGDGGPAIDAALNAPIDVYAIDDGTLYIADTGNHRIRKVMLDGTIATIAGDGFDRFSGDGNPAANASLSSPVGVYAAADGDVYIADVGNGRVRRIDSAGIIQTIAGNGIDTDENDGGLALDAGIGAPLGIDGDDAGQLWLADTEDQRVRWVDTDGIIHTLWPNVPLVLAVNTGATIDEGSTLYLGSDMLRAEDEDDLPDQLIYTVVTAPLSGQLLRNFAPLQAGDLFTQADIDAGLITYVHSGDNSTADSFAFVVSDDRVSLPGATFPIAITPVNDEPLADAGADQELLAPGRYIYALLDAGGSSDPDGTGLTYTWEIDDHIVAHGDRHHAEMPWVVVETGTHVARLTVTDPSGAVATDDVTITVHADSQAPIIALSAPTSGVVVRAGKVHLEGTVQEEIVLQSLSVNGRSKPFIGHAPQYAFSVETSLEQSGANQITIEAIDISGNVGTHVLEVIRDTDDPVITIAEPQSGSLLIADEPQVLVRGTAVDAGVGVGEVTVNGVVAQLDGADFNATVNLGGEGTKTLTIKAVDELGNSATTRLDIQVDTRAPKLNVDTPVHRSVVETGVVTVAGATSDAGTGVASLTINGETAAVNSDAFSHDLDLEDGSHEIQVVATDGAGRQTTSALTVEVRTGPAADPTVDALVLDSQGQPLAECRVDLLKENGKRAGQRQFTAENGRVSFVIDPEKIYLLRVNYADGQHITEALQAGDEATVQLVATALQLLDSRSVGMADVRVYLRTADDKSTGKNSRTDADGLVHFDVLPGFEHRFLVKLHDSTHLTDLGTAASPTIVTTAKTALHLTTSTGAPLSGIRVDLLKEDGSGTGERTDTDTDGLASFELLPGFTHRFAVRYAGDILTTETRTAPGVESVQTTVSSLTLTNVDSQPLAGARVTLLKADGTSANLQMDTDVAGTASFELLNGQTHQFRVAYNSATHTPSAWVSPTAVEVQTARSTLTLLDHQGIPLSGSRVDLLHDNGAGAGERATTELSGAASFDLLPGDIHALRVHLHGGTYTAGPLSADEDAAIQTHWSRLSLTDADGTPVTGARVTLLRPDSTSTSQKMDTDAAGMAGFEVLPDQHVRFKIAHNGDSYITDMVPAGELATLTLGLAANAVELVLTDSHGLPYPGVRVDLLKENGKSTGENTTTDAAGLAAFTVVPDAKQKLRVKLHGATYTTDVVAAGSRTQLQTGETSLMLLDSADQPLEGVRVNLTNENGNNTGEKGNTDAAGMVRFELLPDHIHAFKITYHGGTLQTATVVFAEDAQVRTERTELLLLDAGAPLADVKVVLLKENGTSAGVNARTDAAGRVGFELLPGQIHALKARVSGEWYFTGQLTGGQETTLDVSEPAAKLAANGIPQELALLAAYPNPFNPATTLRFVLDANAPVRLIIYNAAGQQVRLLVDGERQAGENTAVWDGRNDSGRLTASGTYLYILQAGAQQLNGRVTFLR